jgi:hypothetical protein
MAVIPAPQEVDKGELQFKASSGKKLSRPYLRKQAREPCMVVHACNPSHLGGRDPEDLWFEASPGKKLVRPYVYKQARSGSMHFKSQLCRRRR